MAEDSPPTPSRTSEPTWSQVWHLPVLMLGLGLLVVGISGTIGQMLLAQSLRESDPGVVMPFDFVKLLWAALLGFWLFGELPDLFVWLGGAVIFARSTYLAWREATDGRRETPPVDLKAGPGTVGGRAIPRDE